MIETVVHGGETLAMILRANFKEDGIHFFTPREYAQQLGYMRRPRGHVIQPHVHNPVHREVTQTSEVLFVRSGVVKVDFYTSDRDYVESRVLQTGDVLLLVSGGHGFEMLEHTEMIEVKQGPYAGEHDKTLFNPDAAQVTGVQGRESS